MAKVIFAAEIIKSSVKYDNRAIPVKVIMDIRHIKKMTPETGKSSVKIYR